MPAATLPAPASADSHVTAAEAIRRWPLLSRAKLYYHAMVGEVRFQLPPGRPPRYAIRDLERVMRERSAAPENQKARGYDPAGSPVRESTTVRSIRQSTDSDEHQAGAGVHATGL
jgi:hypothetical protein